MTDAQAAIGDRSMILSEQPLTVSRLFDPSSPSASTATNPVAVYLAALGNDRSRRTMRVYLSLIAQIATGDHDLAPECLPWQQMRYQHVAAIRAALSERVTPRSANTALSALRGVLKACWRLGLMSAEDYHTARSVDAVIGETLPAGREISAGERSALFAVCATDPSAAGRRDAALVALLYGCGIRRAEAASLDMAHYEREEGRFRLVGKRSKERYAYVTASGVAEALDDWLAVRAALLPSDQGPVFVRVQRGGKLFANQRLTAQGIYEILQTRARQAGVAKLSPHDFRRTFVGDLLDAGVDIATVSRMAGHASVTTTARYDRRPEAAKRKAAAVLHVPYVRTETREE
jgi:site-specific recombinase XerD